MNYNIFSIKLYILLRKENKAANQIKTNMSFQNAFDSSSNLVSGLKTFTENGAVIKATTGKPLLDLDNSLVRKVTVENIVEHLNKCYETKNPTIIANLFILLFKKRDCRGGEGEKELSYNLFIQLWDKFPKTCIMVLELFPLYGYYLDLFQIWKTVCQRYNESIHNSWIDNYMPLIRRIVAICSRLRKITLDRYNDNKVGKDVVEGDPMEHALLFKWIPSEGCHYDINCFAFTKSGYKVSAIEYLIMGYQLVSNRTVPDSGSSVLNGLKKQYRKDNKLIRNELVIPESLMCANKWSDIKIERLCSRFMTKCRLALLNKTKSGEQRDSNPSRIELAHRMKIFMFEKGLNGSQNLPHELLTKMRTTSDPDEIAFLIAQWNDLRNTTCSRVVMSMLEELKKTPNPNIVVKMMVNFIPVSDVSGSMSVIPMDVSIALGVFFSDFTHLLIDYMKSFVSFLASTANHSLDDIKKTDYYKNTNSVMRQNIDKIVDDPEIDSFVINVFIQATESINKKDYLVNRAISFTEKPSLFTFNENDTPIDKARMFNNHIGYSTNFQEVIKCLLDLCVSHCIPSSSIPSIIAFTDGQFDQMNVSDIESKYSYGRRNAPNWQTCHQTIMTMFKKAGYDRMPDFIYWNLRANTPGFQTTSTHPGVQMMTGYSPAMMNSIMIGQTSGDEEVDVLVDGIKTTMTVSKANPWDTLMKTLNTNRYDPVRDILCESNEGILARYNPIKC